MLTRVGAAHASRFLKQKKEATKILQPLFIKYQK
jgi:hypothetical protein